MQIAHSSLRTQDLKPTPPRQQENLSSALTPDSCWPSSDHRGAERFAPRPIIRVFPLFAFRLAEGKAKAIGGFLAIARTEKPLLPEVIAIVDQADEETKNNVDCTHENVVRAFVRYADGEIGIAVSVIVPRG